MSFFYMPFMAAGLIALSVSNACAGDLWYEGRWTVEGTDCSSENLRGIRILGDNVVFYSPSGGRFSMNIVGDKTEADYAKLTEQAGTITSRKKTQIGYSFLATINHDGAEAGFAMLKEHPQFVTLVAQTGYFSVIRCD